MDGEARPLPHSLAPPRPAQTQDRGRWSLALSPVGTGSLSQELVQGHRAPGGGAGYSSFRAVGGGGTSGRQRQPQGGKRGDWPTGPNTALQWPLAFLSHSDPRPACLFHKALPRGSGAEPGHFDPGAPKL